MPWIAGAVAGGAALNYISAEKAGDKQSEAANKGAAVLQAQNDQARNDLAPYRSAGQAALTRLQQLLGLGAPGGVDETDPRYKALYQGTYDHIDNLHRQQFGMSLSAGTDPAGKVAQMQEIERNARAEYIRLYGADNGTGTDSSPLLRKFTQSDLEADPVYQNGLQFGLDEGTKALERRASAAGGYDSGGTLKALVRFGNDYGSTKAGESYGRFTGDQDRTYGKLSGLSGMGSGATTVGVNAGANTAGNLSNLYTGAGNAAGASTIAQGNAISSGLNGYMNYSLLSQLRDRDLSGGGQRTITRLPEDG